MSLVSADLQLALAPATTYGRLIALPADDRRLVAVRRPAFIALLIGTLVAISATGGVTLGLVFSTTLCWCGAPAVQMLAGAALIASCPRRSTGMARALDLFFAGHVPWSLWLLAMTAWAALTGPPHAMLSRVLLTALVPAVWTAVIVFAFCKTVLQTGAGGAWARTALHQTLIWTFTTSIFILNVGGWARILGVIGR